VRTRPVGPRSHRPARPPGPPPPDPDPHRPDPRLAGATAAVGGGVLAPPAMIVAGAGGTGTATTWRTCRPIRTSSPSCNRVGPLILTPCTVVPLVLRRSSISTSPSGPTVMRAWWREARSSSRTTSQVSSRPMTTAPGSSRFETSPPPPFSTVSHIVCSLLVVGVTYDGASVAPVRCCPSVHPGGGAEGRPGHCPTTCMRRMAASCTAIWKTPSDPATSRRTISTSSTVPPQRTIPTKTS
jgi:hypothetical protein